MNEYTYLLEELGDWLVIRSEVAASLDCTVDPHMQWTLNLEIKGIDERIVEVRGLLEDLEWDITYEDHYAHIVDVEPEPVDEWELLPTYEPSRTYKTRMPLAA